jgi:hypothetical protein
VKFDRPESTAKTVAEIAEEQNFLEDSYPWRKNIEKDHTKTQLIYYNPAMAKRTRLSGPAHHVR